MMRSPPRTAEAVLSRVSLIMENALSSLGSFAEEELNWFRRGCSPYDLIPRDAAPAARAFLSCSVCLRFHSDGAVRGAQHLLASKTSQHQQVGRITWHDFSAAGRCSFGDLSKPSPMLYATMLWDLITRRPPYPYITCMNDFIAPNWGYGNGSHCGECYEGTAFRCRRALALNRFKSHRTRR